MTKLLDLKRLKAHEKINRKRLREVKKMIFSARSFTEPIIVEKKHLVILDGHHRARVLDEMGCKKIPAHVLNYVDRKVRVQSRRANYTVNKKLIIQRALAGQLYPAKTTRHFIHHRPKNLNIKLCKLR